MRLAFAILIVSISFFKCYTQTNRVEKQLTDCWYSSFRTKEKKAKEFIANYEKLLVAESLLKNKTAKSYVNLLREIAHDSLSAKPSRSFYYGLNELIYSGLEGYKECRDEALKDSLNYNVHKLSRFETALDSIIRLDNYTKKDVAKAMLSVLEEEDFNFEYYRLRTFLIYDLQILSEIWDLKFLEDANNMPKEDIVNALNVYMNSEGAIFVNQNGITVLEFQKMIREHAINKKSKAIFFIKTDDNVSYGNFVRLQETIINQIGLIREEYSLQKFNVKFDRLNKEQKIEVSALFPQKLVGN